MEDLKKHSELMIRYLEGNLQDDEYEDLVELLKDPELLEKYDHIKNTWVPDIHSSDQTNYSWNRVKARLSEIEKSRSLSLKTRTMIIRRVASVAAILVLGILIGVTVHNIFQKSENKSNNHIVFETPRGERSKITLPDGTEVYLNAKSKLEYNGFVENERNIKFIGEAFFKVSHNEKQPFIVETNRAKVKVLGTEFNITAYEEFGRDEVSLVTGSVEVTSGRSEMLLVPGEMAIINDSSIRKQKINTDQVIGWVNNRFNFSEIPLDELMLRLENWYNVDIELYNPKKKNITFSGVFKNEETIWQVLDVMKIYVPIQYDRTDLRKIKVYVE